MSQSSLCLNMIVRNEMTNLSRCLASVAPWITSWAILDTGSSDGTQDYIRNFFADRNIPGKLGEAPFINFEQARNAALDHAAKSGLAYDYLLLIDADMELVAEDNGFLSELSASAYYIQQRSPSLAYWNTRLLHRDASARYSGVTHEYIKGDFNAEKFSAAYFIDHATGSNRADKFERDIRLLLEALSRDPDNARHLFYLAQSYRDAGQFELAVQSYAKRVTLGGWDEEVWNAQLQKARCLLSLGDDVNFVAEALKAYNLRPHRAEPLHDLSRYYRNLSQHQTALLFAEKALSIPFPEKDMLFVEAATYHYGALEELSISGFYAPDPAMQARSARACNALAIGEGASEATRSLARHNLFYYYKGLAALVPSCVDQRIDFTPPEGYVPLNPSIARVNGDLFIVIRTVNYKHDENGILHTPDGIIRTRNFLSRVGSDLSLGITLEIHPPDDFAGGKSYIRGFEDMRLFHWNGELWTTSTVRDLTEEAWCEQVLARIDTQSGRAVLTDWRVLRMEGPQLHEKNWMPFVDGEDLFFVYSCAPTLVLDAQAAWVTRQPSLLSEDALRGGSQLVAFEDGWLCATHSVGWQNGQRTYHHWFVWFDSTYALKRVSPPFFLHEKGVEFIAGLAWMPDEKRLAISYGLKDRDARLCLVEAADISVLMEDLPDFLRVGFHNGFSGR